MMVRKRAVSAHVEPAGCAPGSFPVRLAILALAVIFLALAAWGCAVVPAQPYDAYYGGPYYSYSSSYYTPGYYAGPYYSGPYYRGYSGPYRGRYHHSGRGRRR